MNIYRHAQKLLEKSKKTIICELAEREILFALKLSTPTTDIIDSIYNDALKGNQWSYNAVVYFHDKKDISEEMFDNFLNNLVAKGHYLYLKDLKNNGIDIGYKLAEDALTYNLHDSDSYLVGGNELYLNRSGFRKDTPETRKEDIIPKSTDQKINPCPNPKQKHILHP